MLTLEGTLNAIWEFIGKIFLTFYHSFFRTKLFFNNLIKNPTVYISAKTYLFISVFTNYFIFRGFQSGSDYEFLGFLDIRHYKKAFLEIRAFSVLDIIFASAPFALIAYCLILLVVKCLHVNSFWKKFFTDSAVYLFASTRLLFSVLFLTYIFSIAIISKFPQGKTAINGGMIVIFYLVLGIVVLLLPVVRLRRKISYLDRGVLVKFFVLQLLILASCFLTIYPFVLEDILSEMVLGKPEKDSPIKLFNSRMQTGSLIMYYKINHDSSTNVSCSFVLENKSAKTCYILKGDPMTMNLYSRVANGDQSTWVLDMDTTWVHDQTDMEVLLIKPNDYLAISFTKKLDKSCYTLIDILKQNMPALGKFDVFFSIETTRPSVVHGLFGDFNNDVIDLFRDFKIIEMVPK